jgi:hypothetical protein
MAYNHISYKCTYKTTKMHSKLIRNNFHREFLMLQQNHKPEGGFEMKELYKHFTRTSSILQNKHMIQEKKSYNLIQRRPKIVKSIAALLAKSWLHMELGFGSSAVGKANLRGYSMFIYNVSITVAINLIY